MKLKTLKSALLTLSILCGVMAIGAYWSYSEVSELRNEHITLSQQAKAIALVKSRWSLSESQNDIDYLKSHPNLIKQEKRGGNLYLEYDNLSSSEFNLLSNRVLNSMVVIKKMTLQHRMSKGVIIVEIEL